ncbi:MAG: hypothetical protein AB4426_00060 [Xenococcaceae cyanobacterium]
MILDPATLKKQELKSVYETLVQQYQELGKKLTFSEADACVRIEKQMENIFGQMVKLYEKIYQSGTTGEETTEIAAREGGSREDSETQLVRQALLSLNYTMQSRQFKKFWQEDINRQVGAFLIHGKSQCCQRWLVNRLVHSIVPEVILDLSSANKFSIFTPQRDTYIEDLWKQFSEQLPQKPKPEAYALAQSVYQEWQKETVILVFHGLEQMRETQPKHLITQFWSRLVQLVEAHPQESCSSLLLMFLIDNRGRASEWEIDFAVCLEDWELQRPLDLMPIEGFSYSILENWVKSRSTRQLPGFPSDSKQLQSVTQAIWDDSREGIPVLAMDSICSICGYRWYAIEEALDL